MFIFKWKKSILFLHLLFFTLLGYSQEVTISGGIINDSYFDIKSGNFQIDGGYTIYKGFGSFVNLGYKFGQDIELQNVENRLDLNAGIFKDFFLNETNRLRIKGGVGYGWLVGDFEENPDLATQGFSPFIAIGYYIKIAKPIDLSFSYGKRGSDRAYDFFNFGITYTLPPSRQN